MNTVDFGRDFEGVRRSATRIGHYLWVLVDAQSEYRRYELGLRDEVRDPFESWEVATQIMMDAGDLLQRVPEPRARFIDAVTESAKRLDETIARAGPNLSTGVASHSAGLRFQLRELPTHVAAVTEGIQLLQEVGRRSLHDSLGTSLMQVWSAMSSLSLFLETISHEVTTSTPHPYRG